VTNGRAGGSRVRTVFLGSGGFGLPALRRLAEHPDVELVGVVTAPPRLAGRRQVETTTEVDAAARTLGVSPILTHSRLGAPEAVASVLELGPGLAVLADYGQLVPPSLLDLPHGALNLHPSLLPRHRGATPIPAAILAGDPETGVTLMRMDQGLDTGPIVARRRQSLTGRETAPDLEARLAEIAADLLVDTLGAWLRGAIAPQAQPVEGATLTRRLTREDGRLDPERPALELERQVRAYQPWPGSFVDTTFGRIAVWLATPEASNELASGVFDERGLGVGHGERLAFVEVQPAGGDRMPWAAFLRGRPGIVGTRALASDS
jgi:methionyl-tRNA formyltransferase